MLPTVWMARGRGASLVRAQHTAQMLLAEDDHMIEALASDRADESFGIAVLPWRSRRCRSVANAHRSDAARKCLSVDPIPITDEVCAIRYKQMKTIRSKLLNTGRRGDVRRSTFS